MWHQLQAMGRTCGMRAMARLAAGHSADVMPGPVGRVLARSARFTPEVPLRVEYQLSNLGQEIVPVLEQLHAWGSKLS